MAEILTKLSLHIQAGTANPAPPIGTALGPHGINIVDFCKEYNEKTSDQKGQIIPAEITIYESVKWALYIMGSMGTIFILFPKTLITY